jgi:RNA polymerase sigma-70 factor (ECF subfamily)
MLRSISTRTGPDTSVASNERELQLLRRVAAQDRAAFKELYVIYHRRLMRFISRLTSRHELAEEIINDTLWIVWKKAEGFRAASQVSTWVLGIAYRQALTTLRRAGPPADAQDASAREALAEDTQALAETRQWLDRGLALLPLEQRMVLEFTYYLGHSCEEIATLMECPVNTVKTRMFHARRKLRASLGELAQQRSHE